MVFQLGGQVGGFRRLVLGAPVVAVIRFPLALERLGIAAMGPELGFFQEDMVHPGVDDALDVPLLEVGEIVLSGNDVRDHRPVPDGIPFHPHLAFVQMPFSVPTAGEIILITAPGDAGHEMRLVPPLPPGSQPGLHATRGVLVRGIPAHAVHHHGVGPVVDGRPPSLRRLERRLHGIPDGTRAGQNAKERQASQPGALLHTQGSV